NVGCQGTRDLPLPAPDPERVVGGPPGLRWHRSFEPELLQIELLNEGIYDPNRFSSPIQSSSRSGNSRLCVRGSPSMNRLIRYSTELPRQQFYHCSVRVCS